MGQGIVKSQDSALSALTINNPIFAETYGAKVEEIAGELPSSRSMQEIIDALPESLQEKILVLAKKLTGKKKGQYGEQDSSSLTELKLYQGTGKDLNRPDRQIPGEFYLTTKTSVGPKFRGAVLTYVNGQSKWDSNDSSQPSCRSMDRKMGSNFGECKNCVHLPWRNKQRQDCGRDVTVYMVPETLDDIVLCRFTKTSEPTGKRLVSFINKGIGENWSRWFDFTSEEKEMKTDASKRYFTWDVEPVAGSDGYTPEELDAFFYALCTMVEATYILPGIARIYEQAADGNPGGSTNPEGAGSSPVDDGDNSAYGNVPTAVQDDAPEM